MAIAAGALVLSSCTDDKDYYDPNFEKNLATKNFQAMLGEGVTIDQNHTWETVKNVNVSLPINYGTGVNFSVTYYANDKIVGTAKVKDGQVLKSTVSVPSYTETLSVSLSGDNGLGTVIKLNVAGTASRAASRAEMSIGEFDEVIRSPYMANYGFMINSGAITSYWVNQINPPAWGDDFKMIEGALSTGTPLSQEVIDGILEVVPENDLSEVTKAQIVGDYNIVVKEDGPISLKFAYSKTSNHAAIGYYIYTDGTVDNTESTESDWLPILKDAYYDATGESWEDITSWGWESGSSHVVKANPNAQIGDKKKATKFVVVPDLQDASIQNGTNIQLLYVNKNGEYSETFPAGTKIGFFILPDANYDSEKNSIKVANAVYSFAEMNKEVHLSGGVSNVVQTISDGNNSYVINGGSYYTGWNSEDAAMSHVATFQIGDKIVVGFEDAQSDNTDFDYNDFLFTLDGSFEPTIPVVPETSDPQTYTYCFEDMEKDGGDYDFNDVVLKVTAPVDGKINVTLDAAGATYALRVKLGSSYLFDGKEVHEVFGVTQDVMVNTGTGTICNPVTETVSVGENWNIMDNGDFYIVVEDRGGLEVHIPTFQPGFVAGEVPYAIRIASDFDYPSERQAIVRKYPAFVDWAEDATSEIDWYNK